MKPGAREYGAASLKVNVAKALPQHMRAHCYELTSVHTAPEARGNGLASILLSNTCLDADLAGKFLMVNVDPGEDSPLDHDALTAFYGRFGFRTIQDYPAHLMVRPCVSGIKYGQA